MDEIQALLGCCNCAISVEIVKMEKKKKQRTFMAHLEYVRVADFIGTTIALSNMQIALLFNAGDVVLL